MGFLCMIFSVWHGSHMPLTKFVVQFVAHMVSSLIQMQMPLVCHGASAIDSRKKDQQTD